MLDTGSPISIMPPAYRELLKPKRLITEGTKRNFVDVNNNPVKIFSRYHLKINLLEKTEKLLWWEVKELDFPILGIDNFQKMGLKVIQDAEDKIKSELNANKEREKTNLEEKVGKIEDEESDGKEKR